MKSLVNQCRYNQTNGVQRRAYIGARLQQPSVVQAKNRAVSRGS